MVLHYLLIELLSLVDLLDEGLTASLVIEVLLTLIFLKLGLLVAKLHQYALMISSLLLNLSIQLVVFILDCANLFIWQVDGAEHIGWL